MNANLSFMTTGTKGSFRRKLLRIVLVAILILAAALAGLYIWFVHNSNRLLINLVKEKSEGKLQLQVSHVTFDFFSNEVKIKKAKISSTAKDQSNITYQVGFQKITLTTNSLFSAFFSNALEIRKLKLYEPVIEIFKRKRDSVITPKDNLSLGMELGKLYHSVDDAVTSLNTHSISLFNAKVILSNETSKGTRRLVLSNIYFSLKKLNKHKNPEKKYLENNDVLFSSSNQDITLTDGLHKLSFKKLVIERGKSIILDSCTIIGLPTEVSPSSYEISFKRLALKGVDFDAIYRSDIIKADSVYCRNPSIYINLNSSQQEENRPIKKMPDPGKILSEFAGNLDLGFVGVMDGDIHLNIKSKNTQSDIHSEKVKFQIQKLRISPDSASPVSINSFDMLIKNYKLYNADSSCIYSFDSIRFANNTLLLNNFSVHTTSGIYKIRNSRDFDIPYFQLLGVDWPELIFEQNLKAHEAVLYRPTINYTKVAKVDNPKKSILFNSRHTLDDFMDIDILKIFNGKINVYWNNGNSLQLLGLGLNFSGDNLVDYKRMKKQDIESLFFKNGYLKLGDIAARLNNVTFKTNNEIHADDLLIDNNEGGINLKINDVSIKNIYSEDRNNIVIDGLQWEHGNIIISSIPQRRRKEKVTSITLTNLMANQTQLKFLNGNVAAGAFIDNMQIVSAKKSNNNPLAVKGLNLKGKRLSFSNPSTQVSADKFILENEAQQFSKLHFENSGYAGTLVMNIPLIHLAANLDSLLTNNFYFKNVSVSSPVIKYTATAKATATNHPASSLPAIKIDHLSMQEPAIDVAAQNAVSSTNFLLPFSKGNEIKGDYFALSRDSVNITSLKIKAEKVLFKSNKSSISVDEGIDASLTKINIPLTGNGNEWKTMLINLDVKNSQAFSFDIKGNKLRLKNIAAGGFEISTSSINDVHKLINANGNAWFSTASIQYQTKNSVWQFNNAKYNGSGNELAVDSIAYHPLLSRDAAIKSNPYQMDYINFTSGKATFSGINTDEIFSKNLLAVQKAVINDPRINVYRDKLPPFQLGRKKLLTEQIREIEIPLLINEIGIKEGTVSYTEKTAKTRQEGNLLLTHLNGNILNLKNTQLVVGDSLSILLKGSLLDKTSFNIGIRESYLDPLYGFSTQLNIQPYAMNILNPLLAPLSSVKFVYGDIDKFEMSAAGNENVAYGEMKLYYHDLRVQLLKNGGLEKTTFLKKAESDLVNFFFLKNKNESGTGLIYFQRLKDYSFFNYLNKIIFSGITTNISERKNRKFRKIYRKNNIVNNATPAEKN